MSAGRATRAPLPSYASSWRAFTGKVFAVFAFCVTFLGLAILVLFFVRLGLDVRAWFRTMPGLVQERNAELAASVARARDTKLSAEQRLREIDQEMEEELKEAPNEAARAQIRKEFDGFKLKELADLEITNRELRQGAEYIRPDTSPTALLKHFLTQGPSSQPEDAGILPALLGSLLLVLITIVTAMPLGVGAAIYLEEYRQNSRLARFIQVNINNLAGVPSVMYGILGAYLFVELVFKRLENDAVAARNVLGGGLTLALLTLPVIIVSSQEAIRAVPASLRHASLALGATRWQTIARIVLPSALPGILTGMILAMCRAMGEAAPLVLFGALLFVNHNPTLFSRFTVLPMQIFGWSDRPGELWQYNAAMASTLLVVTLLALNATAIYLRQRAQRKLRG